MIYDCIIIGGGPAGLSAAIYLARFRRSTLIVDKRKGRSTWPQINENYLGFPNGISARNLRKLGKKQAQKFGAIFKYDSIKSIRKESEAFNLFGEKYNYYAKTVIIATGVNDIFPEFEGFQSYVGKSLFWCITCDGYKVRNQRVAVVGRTDESVSTCMQFLNFTPHLTFITNCESNDSHVSESKLVILKKAGIPVYKNCIKSVYGRKGMMHKIVLDSGEELDIDFMFNQQGSIPNTKLSEDLNLKLDKSGFIMVTTEQRTSEPYIYAAGDITHPHSHQIVTAAHEGSMAAQCANYDLYNEDQK